MSDHVRLRVDRFLSGDRRPRDLDVIFTDLRFRCSGNQAIRDVGNFVAHAEERDRGIACESIRNLALCFKLHMEREHARKQGDPLPGSVADLRDAALAALSMDTPERVRQKTLMGKKQAKRCLERAYAKIDSFEGNVPVLNDRLTLEEKRVMRRYFVTVLAMPAFIDDDLVAQLGDCLIRNKFMLKSQQLKLREARDYLALYVIERMNLANIDLRNGEYATLRLGYKLNSGLLSIDAWIPMAAMGIQMHVSNVAFATHYDPSQWCEPELLLALEAGGSREIEISDSGLLQML